MGSRRVCGGVARVGEDAIVGSSTANGLIPRWTLV